MFLRYISQITGSMVSYGDYNSSTTMKSAVEEGLYPPFMHATVIQPLCCARVKSLEFTLSGTNLKEPKFTIPVKEFVTQLPGMFRSRYTLVIFCFMYYI